MCVDIHPQVCVHSPPFSVLIFTLYTRQFFSLLGVTWHQLSGRTTVSDREGLGVSGSIRSIKMYSFAQCAMQEKSMYCRDVPCLAHMEHGPDPLRPEHLPPSLSAWVLGTQSASSSQQGWTWIVQWTLASSPTQNLWPLESDINIVLYFPSSKTVFWNAYLNDYQWLSA